VGDVENEKVVWKSASAVEEMIEYSKISSPIVNSSRTLSLNQDTTRWVPWDDSESRS